MTRNVRRITVGAVVAVMAMLASISPAGAFTDVPPNHPFRTEITWAASNGLVNGYSDGTFRGSNQVTRQAASAFLYRLAGQPAFPVPGTASFTDVPTSYVFFEEIEWMAYWGYTTGYEDGRFRPGGPVTRQAMAAFLYRFLGSPTPTGPLPWVFNDVSPSHPFFVPIMFIWDFYIADGYATPFGYVFKPGGVVSRQAAAAFLYRTVQAFGTTATGAERSATPGTTWDVEPPTFSVPTP